MTLITILRTSESTLAGFAVGLIVIVFGFWTGLDLNSSLDIPLQDTYYVLSALRLLIVLVLLIGGSYLLTLGLKRLSQKNRVGKIISVGPGGIGTAFFLMLYLLVLYTVPNQSSIQLVNSALAIRILFYWIGSPVFLSDCEHQSESQGINW